MVDLLLISNCFSFLSLPYLFEVIKVIIIDLFTVHVLCFNELLIISFLPLVYVFYILSLSLYCNLLLLSPLSLFISSMVFLVKFMLRSQPNNWEGTLIKSTGAVVVCSSLHFHDF